jgi:hypothetical protein
MAITTSGAAGEEELVASVRIDDAWALVERFTHLVRSSGSEQEREAVAYITSRLDQWGIPNTFHTPEAWISLPLGASLTVGDRTYHAKTPSMAASTPASGVTAPIVYQPAGYPSTINDLFAGSPVEGDRSGKLVLTEGLAMPARVAELEARGVVGAIFIGPGERIHEGICTTIWGAPDVTSWNRQPRIPVVSVSRSDGAEVIERARAQAMGTIVATHDTGWRPIPVVVAEIRGSLEPERFVLLHGHLDSWHVGIGDNATGNGTLLEVARVLAARRDQMARSVRICWWSGHSHGRYAGSTWYADTHANDIARNCICHINCDSPGCRDATAFADISWSAELEAFGRDAIGDLTGLGAEGGPAPRAGDISFNNLGVSTFLMLSSTIPETVRVERGLYAVGGCGANIEWHTEADTIEVADRDNLLRDMRVYAGAVFRAANLPVHPLDFRATLQQIESSLQARQGDAGGVIELDRTFTVLRSAREALDELSRTAERADSVAGARPLNDALLRIGRALVPVLYTREGKYRQDPALDFPLLPDFSVAVAARGSVPDGVIRTELVRARNRLEGALLEVADAARAVTG